MFNVNLPVWVIHSWCMHGLSWTLLLLIHCCNSRCFPARANTTSVWILIRSFQFVFVCDPLTWSFSALSWEAGRSFSDDLSGNSNRIGSCEYDAHFGLSHMDSHLVIKYDSCLCIYLSAFSWLYMHICFFIRCCLFFFWKENAKPGRKSVLDDALFQFFRKEVV
jgi:hypothetical protein